jgi:hypothetical protein
MARLQAFVFWALFAGSPWAQDKSQSVAASPRAVPHAVSKPSHGAVSDGVYRNPWFGFSYKLPYGWVDRTADMKGDSADSSKSRLLLAIFERPPEATGDTINSAVVVAAEPLAPGEKTAADYFESLDALISDQGFQAAQDPQGISIGPAKLVRGDFSKARGKLTMRQTSLVALVKGYAVSFTFVAGSEDEVNELIEKLSFTASKPQH